MPTKKKSATTKKSVPAKRRAERSEDFDVSKYMTLENHRETEALLTKLEKPARKAKSVTRK